MVELLTTLAPFLGPTGLLAAVVVYIIINSQRKSTKSERDNDYQLLEYRVGQLENNQSSLTDSIKELQNSIIQLQISINSLVIEVKNLKDTRG